MTSMPAAFHRHAERPPKAVALSLRVLSGVHAGAELRLPGRGILMIGRADDCDLILSDEGIAEHHGVLTVVGDQVLLRALEGEVGTHEGQLAAGENMALEHFAVVRLGEVRFAVGPHWSERWQSLADAVDAGRSELTARQRSAHRRGVLAMAGALLVIAVLVLVGGWQLAHPGPPPTPAQTRHQQLEQVRKILDRLALRHVKASEDAGGRLVVRGIVGNAAQLPRLQQQLKAAGLAVELAARDWPGVAKQVREIFAMHGYTVETSLLEPDLAGRNAIEVAGHFGTPETADKVKRDVLGSADMQSLDADALGLALALKNYDETAPPPPTPDPGKRIRRVVSGEDSYLITQDNSRYYPGAQLPQGGTFLGVDENANVLVREGDNRIMQLGPADSYQAPHALEPMASIAAARLAGGAPADAASAAAPAASASAGGGHAPARPR